MADMGCWVRKKGQRSRRDRIEKVRIKYKKEFGVFSVC